MGDKTTYNRLGFSKIPYEKTLVGQSDETIGQKESKFSNDGGEQSGFLPRVIKKLFTSDSFIFYIQDLFAHDSFIRNIILILKFFIGSMTTVVSC